MKFDEETIYKLADLLMIGLTEEENKMIKDEFNIIDNNINKINNIKGIENIKPMTHCLDDFSVELRKDVAEESTPIEDLLRNCDVTDGDEVVVPKVVE